MKKKLLSLLPMLFFFTFCFSQDAEEIQPHPTLEQQFIEVVDESNDYQEYKVIKRAEINTLRKNILDSIAALETKIDTAYASIGRQKNQIASLEQELKATNNELVLTRDREDSISLLGIATKKSTYNFLMWSIIILLLLGLLFFIYKFMNSHAVTKEAQLRLAETEIEYEAHRQKALENEQKIRRKLQDELNKNKLNKNKP
jgi:septal ring factor EnvC (AmiA/AmiB activator)